MAEQDDRLETDRPEEGLQQEGVLAEENLEQDLSAEDSLPADRLRGWKEIADFLHAAPRTVQRWEQRLGLPVHRVPNARGHIVFVSRAEVIAWQESAAGRDAQNDIADEANDSIFRRLVTYRVPLAVVAGIMIVMSLGFVGLRMLRPATNDEAWNAVTEVDSNGQPRVRTGDILYMRLHDGSQKAAPQFGVAAGRSASMSFDGSAPLHISVELTKAGPVLHLSIGGQLQPGSNAGQPDVEVIPLKFRQAVPVHSYPQIKAIEWYSVRRRNPAYRASRR